ncbi:MAG: pyruvate dehydrogenase (acetyl-transferring) E1 component subunit alpha [Acidimicrobiia bacterium]|nr:pyruvate dehydrogenase (acetyl-transferring) E1 component subunit alpha [Acidimicrobiia bacterium]
MHQVLQTDGTLRAAAPLDVSTTRQLYAAMVAARTYDHKGTTLQKQGRLATYASFLGQEACQIGATGPLRPDDWLVATYRDAGAMWAQGYPWVNLFLGRTGDERGGAAPPDVNVLPPSITVGAHMIHAVGLAWAEQYRGTDRVALTMFGDGATSEGDFHEAMNFAGVFGVPVIFLCQNNHYAISTPRHRQTAAETLAAKADGYGMPGRQVDGNDLFAVYDAVAAAVADARAGGGPTFIEAVTYRLSPHTTADDPGRYRPAAEEEEWRARDPLDRVRRYLEANGEWSPAWQDELEQAAAADVDAAITAAEQLEPLGATAVFDAVFAEPTPQLLRQRNQAATYE